MEPIETFSHNGFKVEIHRDTDPTSPLEYDNLVTIACWHTRYLLGDKQINHLTKEEMCEDVGDIIAILPLYLYDHSGITMNTTGFSCGWDSGQVGWAYVTKESAEKMGCVGPDWTTERLEDNIRGEITTYDNYLTGQVYGYRVLNDEGEELESCWGYIGNMEDARSDARAITDHLKGK